MKEVIDPRRVRYEALSNAQKEATLKAVSSYMLNLEYEQFTEDLLTIVWRSFESKDQDMFPETMFQHWAQTQQLVRTCRKIANTEN